jgi:ABC-2 type transport system ATP-binding protein
VFLRERPVYLLDEPTSNLDPKVAREIRALILDASRDKLVLYSSHNLFEAREIGRFVLLLRQGRLALFDRIENLRGSRYVVGIRVVAPSPALDGLPRRGEYYLREVAGPDQVPELVRQLVSAGVQIREVREMENPLEELFT